MASLAEIAIGVSSALAHPATPDPLTVQLRGHGATDASELVLSIINECADAGITLKAVRLDHSLCDAHLLGIARDGPFRGTLIQPDKRVSGELLVYRS